MEFDDLVTLLGNEYTAELLGALHHPKSAHDLSDEVDIPIATCYRRLNALADANLIRRIEYDDSHPTEYQRTISKVRVSFGRKTVETVSQPTPADE